MKELAETHLRPTRAGNISIENRERINVTGISDVDSFNDAEILVITDDGRLTIFGQGLHIAKLDLDEGVLAVDGLIGGIEYTDTIDKQGGHGLFSKLFR